MTSTKYDNIKNYESTKMVVLANSFMYKAPHRDHFVRRLSERLPFIALSVVLTNCCHNTWKTDKVHDFLLTCVDDLSTFSDIPKWRQRMTSYLGCARWLANRTGHTRILKGHRHDWWCLFTISFFPKLLYISSMKPSQNRMTIFKLIVLGIELHATFEEREKINKRTLNFN